MKPRSRFRNEVKTRLDDRLYDALQSFKQHHGFDSDSAALARIAAVALFGVVGILPATNQNVSAEVARDVPREIRR